MRAGGRIHHILFLGVLRQGKLPRTCIKGTQFNSRHIAQAEIFGLIKRTTEERTAGSKVEYEITQEGYNAFWMLQKVYNGKTTNDEAPPLTQQEFEIQIALGSLNMNTKFTQLNKNYKFVKVPINIDQKVWEHHFGRTW
jgi:hypothetical protein